MTRSPRGGVCRRATRSRPDRAGTIASRKSTVSRRGAKKTGLLSVFVFPCRSVPRHGVLPAAVLSHIAVFLHITVYPFPLFLRGRSRRVRDRRATRAAYRPVARGAVGRLVRNRRSPRAASGTARPFAKAEKDGRILLSPLAKGKAVRYNMDIVCIFALCALSRAHAPARPALSGTRGRTTGVRGSNPYAPPPPPPDTRAFGR